MKFSELIGKRVVAFRGLRQKKSDYSKATEVPFRMILFDDGKTILTLDEQDYYTYHDCAQGARILVLTQDEALWNRAMNKELGFDEPDDVGHYPW